MKQTNSARARAIVATLLLAAASTACGRPSNGRKQWPGALVHVAAGDQESCVIDAAGAAKCWGSNAAQPPPGLYRALDVDLWGCGIRPTGELACWGPAPTLPPPSGVFIAVAAGHEMCALASTGAIQCWLVAEGRSCTPGAGGKSVCVPIRPPPYEPLPGDRFTKLAVSAAFGAGLRTNGDVRVWGDGETGDRLGRMVSPGRLVPPPGPWVDIAAGSDFLCGLSAAGSVACWSMRPLPEMDPPGGVRFTHIAARGQTACGIDDGGALHCWGKAISWYGKVYAPPRGSFDLVSVGRAHACARAVDGTVSCWGVDQQGQVTGEPPSLLFRN